MKNKFTKRQFDKLCDENIRKRDYDSIIDLINLRFGEIVLLIKPAIKNKGWFDYGNCTYSGEESGGFFDPKEYNAYIDVGGEWADLPTGFEEEYGENSFPTCWLWTSNEKIKEVIKKIERKYETAAEAKKAKAKKQRETRKENKEKFEKIIRKKLTKEELKHVKFK